jgi:hypothetical protein
VAVDPTQALGGFYSDPAQTHWSARGFDCRDAQQQAGGEIEPGVGRSQQAGGHQSRQEGLQGRVAQQRHQPEDRHECHEHDERELMCQGEQWYRDQ